jgi:cytochrome c-type biogenesis protein CcmF
MFAQRATVTALVVRWPQLRDSEQLQTIVSRESGFLLNNLLLVGIAFATYWGTIFPVLSEAIRGVKVTVGAPFYQQVNGPLLLVLLVLMGIGPLLPWRRASAGQLRRSFLVPLVITGIVATALVVAGLHSPAVVIALAAAAFAAGAVVWEYWRGIRARMSHGESAPLALWRLVGRARSRYGGYLVHLGITCLAVGVVGSSFYQLSREVTMPVGSSMTIGRYTLTHQGLREGREPGARTVSAQLGLSEDGGAARIVTPTKVFYESFNDQPASRIVIETSRLEDLYIVLAGWGDDGTINLMALVNPMVSLIWFGGLILLVGALVTLWPERAPAIVRRPVSPAVDAMEGAPPAPQARPALPVGS